MAPSSRTMIVGSNPGAKNARRQEALTVTGRAGGGWCRAQRASSWLFACAVLAPAAGCSLITSFDGFTSGGASGPSSGDGATRVAPDGYYTTGGTIRAGDGTPHVFHGIWAWADDHLYERDWTDQYPMMKAWKASVIRVQLTQDFWLKKAAKYDPKYETLVDAQIRAIRALNMDVILTLWQSDRGDLTQAPSIHEMPDANSLAFWKEVATKYKNDGRIMFQLYKKPSDIQWPVWRDGGDVGTYKAAGMQTIYDGIRSVGADNLVIVNGLASGTDFTGVLPYRIEGYNVVYGVEAVNYGGAFPAETWPTTWQFLVGTLPVMVFSFGTNECDVAYTRQFLDYANAHDVSWISTVWYPYSVCGPATSGLSPFVVSDWKGTPTPLGAIVKNALASF